MDSDRKEYGVWLEVAGAKEVAERDASNRGSLRSYSKSKLERDESNGMIELAILETSTTCRWRVTDLLEDISIGLQYHQRLLRDLRAKDIRMFAASFCYLFSLFLWFISGLRKLQWQIAVSGFQTACSTTFESL